MNAWLLVVLCAMSGVLVPAPEDVVLVVAGVQVGAGELPLGTAVLAGTVGLLLRDSLFYALGRLLGPRALAHPLAVRWLGAERIDSARDRFVRHGNVAVLVGRGMVGFRTAAFLVAGTMEVPLGAFLLWDTLGLLLMVPLVLGIGAVVGAPAVAAAQWVGANALTVGILVALLLVAVYAVGRALAGPRVGRGAV